MRAVLNAFYPAALAEVPRARHRELQTELVEVALRASRVCDGGEPPAGMDRGHEMTDLYDDFGYDEFVPGDEWHEGLAEEAWTAAFDPLETLLERLRGAKWGPAAKAVLYAGASFRSGFGIGDDFEEAVNEMNARDRNALLDAIAQALGLDAAMRANIEQRLPPVGGGDDFDD
jgi:hypothetical protein